MNLAVPMMSTFNKKIVDNGVVELALLAVENFLELRGLVLEVLQLHLFYRVRSFFMKPSQFEVISCNCQVVFEVIVLRYLCVSGIGFFIRKS